MPTAPHFSLKLRLYRGADIALGPGKIELLNALQETGSISSAARSLNMSYRRAWDLIDTMNQCFKSPLVNTVTGGKGGGGARLTDLGQQVLNQYQSMERSAIQSIEADMKNLTSLLRKL